MKASDDKICLERTSSPEFNEWQWADYWYPLKKIISFKRDVYKQALRELEPLVEKL
jgi:putative (di)nucleoside polyphosphate hydrolase